MDSITHALPQNVNARIVSWNINSLDTTIAEAAGDKTRCKNLSDYVSRVLDADIFCIQEAKLAWENLQPGHNLTGYTSFWSLPKGTEHRGRNGVVTYVRDSSQGVAVKAATATVFEDPYYDDEGRCIVTDHGAFVLFNVYVPNAGVDKVVNADRTVTRLRPRLEYKLGFLKALERKLNEVASCGRQIVVVGDFNIAHTRADTGMRRMLDPKLAWWGFSEEEIGFMDRLVKVAHPSGLIAARNTESCMLVTHALMGVSVSPLEPEPCDAVSLNNRALLGAANVSSSDAMSLDASHKDRLMLIDTFRSCNPASVGCYSMWETRTGGRDSPGERIDYILVTPQLYAAAIEAHIDGTEYPQPFEKDVRLSTIRSPASCCIVDVPRTWSDHAPIAFVMVASSTPEIPPTALVGHPVNDPKCVCCSKRITKLTPARVLTSFFTKATPAARDSAAVTDTASSAAPDATAEHVPEAPVINQAVYVSGLKRSREMWHRS